MSGYFANAQQREQYIAGMRAFLDYLESHPDVPVSSGSEDIQLSTYGDTFAERVQTVEEFAQLVGVEPRWQGYGETHWRAMLTFGPVRFFCIAIKSAEDIAQDALPVAVSR